MNLLAAKLYDPGTAVSKSTASLIAMTAFDTTNLRLTVTVPGHGMLFIRIACVITGATTVPTIFLGVLNGSTVVGRVNPRDFPGTMNAATQTSPALAEFVVTGLTPGSITLDAAYGVEVVVASSAIKYGGPNNTTTNDAWGAFQFEIYDPQPQQTNGQLVVDASGRVDVSKIAGTSQTARDIGASVLLSSGTGAGQISLSSGTVTTGALSSGTITAASIAAAALNGKGDWNIGKTGYSLTQSFPSNFSALAITAGGAVTVGTVNDKTGYSLTTAPLDAAGVRSAVGLASANLDTQLGAVMTSAEYTAPDNGGVAAIKAKTDGMSYTVAGYLDVGLYHVNGVVLGGDGSSGNPWGPA